jgi:hypothetical protein
MSADLPHVGTPADEPPEGAAAVPVPLNVTDVGESVALLVTVTLPFSEPPLAGANVTLRDAVWPGVTTCPADTPVALKPEPLTLTFETVTFEFPPLVKVTGSALLLPTLTLPKFRLLELGFNESVAPFTVSVAALLVTLPALSPTATVNFAPLSEEVVAGVV